MAKTVATLGVSITARTRGLRRGLQRAQKQVDRLANQAKAAAMSIAKVGTSLATVGGGAIAVGVGKAVNSLSDLAKTSDKLNIDPTQLIALRDAAQETGIGVQQFDQGLQRFLRRTQQAAKGTGEAVKVFEAIDIDPRRLVRMRPEEQFLAVAKAMAEAGDETQQLANGMALFDQEGVGLVQTMALLNERGLEPFERHVRKSGRAITREQLKPMESVDDRLRRIGDRIVGVFTGLAKAISPELDKRLEQIENFLDSPDAIRAMRDLFKDLKEEVEGAVDNVRDLIIQIERARDASVGNVARTFKGTGQFIAGAVASVTAGREIPEGATLEERLAIAKENQRVRDRILEEALGDAATTLRPVRNAFFDVVQDTIEFAEETGRAVEQVTRDAIARTSAAVDAAAGGPGGRVGSRGPAGQVFRLERSDGTPISTRGTALGSPMGDAAIQELRRQTEVLQRLDRGTNPASLPPGTMVIQVAG